MLWHKFDPHIRSQTLANEANIMQKPLLSREFNTHAHNIIRISVYEKNEKWNMDSIFTHTERARSLFLSRAFCVFAIFRQCIE